MWPFGAMAALECPIATGGKSATKPAPIRVGKVKEGSECTAEDLLTEQAAFAVV